MRATDFAAWWGAGVATLVLLWDIYKWKKRGPRVTYTVSANMSFYGAGRRLDGTFVTVRVKNRGDAPTTIENMGFAYYKSRWHKIFRRIDSQMVVTNAGVPFELPYVVAPGGIWDGRAQQDESLEAMANNGYLECRIACSHSRRPVTRRVSRIVHKRPAAARGPIAGD